MKQEKLIRAPAAPQEDAPTSAPFAPQFDSLNRSDMLLLPLEDLFWTGLDVTGHWSLVSWRERRTESATSHCPAAA